MHYGLCTLAAVVCLVSQVPGATDLLKLFNLITKGDVIGSAGSHADRRVLAGGDYKFQAGSVVYMNSGDVRILRGAEVGDGLGPAPDTAQARDRDMPKVDIVLERDNEMIAGNEVKASATVMAGDFSGVRAFTDACGDRFVFGAVLYDNMDVGRFGDRLAAAPLSSLWS